jgi:hypothetical protein
MAETPECRTMDDRGRSRDFALPSCRIQCIRLVGRSEAIREGCRQRKAPSGGAQYDAERQLLSCNREDGTSSSA